MSTLRSALDELRSEDLDMASEEELGEGWSSWSAPPGCWKRNAPVVWWRWSAGVPGATDGHLSVVPWLAARVRLGFGRASQQVKLSRALRTMPATSRALGEGELSSEAVGLLVGARQAAPEAFSEAEGMLVDAATALPARELRVAIAYWCQAADASGAEEHTRRLWEGRHLHVSPTIQGTVRIDGSLDPESGQSLLVAVGAIQDAWARDGSRDPRSAPQRRADALVELCRSYLDPGDPGSRASVPTWSSRSTYRASKAGPGGARSSKMSVRSPLRPPVAWRVMPVSRASSPWAPPRRCTWVAGPRSFPQGCAGHWCSETAGAPSPGMPDPSPGAMPTTSSNGPTVGPPALENLMLLCRPHHRAVHEGFRVEMNGHGPVFSRADGSVLAEDRAPP